MIGYCGRPFDAVEQMDADLLVSWNEMVQPDDSVWVLGDLAMGRIDDSLAMAARLNGRKRLLAGNHDRVFRGGHRKSEAWMRRYEEAGFEVHHDSITVDVAGLCVLACHFPYVGDSGGEDRYVDRRPLDDGRSWLLHGHVHERWRQCGRMINVGVDAWAGRPVRADTLAGLIAAGPGELAPLRWRRVTDT